LTLNTFFVEFFLPRTLRTVTRLIDIMVVYSVTELRLFRLGSDSFRHLATTSAAQRDSGSSATTVSHAPTSVPVIAVIT